MNTVPCFIEAEKYALIKKTKKGVHTYSFSSDRKDSFILEVFVGRVLGITDAFIKSESGNYKLNWCGLNCDKDCYRINLCDIFTHPHELFDVVLKCFDKEYCIDLESGVLKDEFTLYALSSHSDKKFLFTYVNDKECEIYKGCIYHIFVDRFNKKDPKIRLDSEYDEDWNNGIPEYAERAGDFIKNNKHFGGNFQGITEKLDYLESLGVDCIYLSPVSKAYSNHKYDVGSYFDIDENLGGEDNLRALIIECHKRSISVILDSVFNHTGDNSKYFNKFSSYNSIGAYQSQSSKYYPWYSFTSYPDAYESWWGIKCMPSIKKGCKPFMDYICGEGGVIDFYMSLGVDGLRLDVADELTLEFIKRINSSVKRNKMSGIVIGEVWENAARKNAYCEDKFYFDENKLNSVTNYPLMNAILDFVSSGNTDSLKKVICEIYTDYPEENALRLMNIISTHDTVRAISRFVTPPSTNHEKAIYKMSNTDYLKSVEKIKVALLLQAFLPGIPCIYYGDEIGMEGFQDPFNRMPMRWNNICYSLLEHYRKIIHIRKNNRPLWKGGLKVKKMENGIVVFDRFLNDEAVRIFINMQNKPVEFKVCGINLYTEEKIESLILPPSSGYPVMLSSEETSCLNHKPI